MNATVTEVVARAYTIPTDKPEADGTLAWNKTTIVIAEVKAANKTGLGYTYAAAAAANIVNDLLASVIEKCNALDTVACWNAMYRATRNLGVGSQIAAAIAAIDTALWDLKAKLLDVSLADLFGLASEAMPVYGSGGFTTYDEKTLKAQIEGWRKSSIGMAKIKIGTHPEDDPGRVAWAREALGADGMLFVDANGAYSVKQALAFAHKFTDYGVSWFEEPVSSDNLDGLRLMREQGPPGMDIAAGEYGYNVFNLHHMLAAKAVDVLQIDATRCLGYTGFLRAAALAYAEIIPISSHCAPALHLPICCHTNARHMEYFHDHVRIEEMLFDGLPKLKNGKLYPDRKAPGHGFVLKQKDAQRFAA